MKIKSTLVLGASANKERYSFLAANRLTEHGHPVILVGRNGGEINGQKIETSLPEKADIDTLTIYLNPVNQQQYYNDIIRLKPGRIIFNPGAENPDFEKLAKENGIETEEACTLVLLSTGQY